MTARYPRLDRVRALDDGTLVADAPTSTPQQFAW
jgi:hypothetical protein